MRLRWLLHDLDSGLEPTARTLGEEKVRRGLSQRLGRYASDAALALNATLHVVVLTQSRVHPPARAYLAKKRAEGKSNKEAFRCLNGTWSGSSSGRCRSSPRRPSASAKDRGASCRRLPRTAG
jgi:hypothetical protein